MTRHSYADQFRRLSLPFSPPFLDRMCITKMAADALDPTPIPRTPSRNRSSRRSDQTPKVQPKSDPTTPNRATGGYSNGSSSYKLDSSATTTSFSSHTSLSSIRDTLPENANIYSFAEIRSATNNFLAKRLSATSSSWRCTLRGKDVVVVQRKFKGPMDVPRVRERLSVICRSHHMSIVKLLGVSISGDNLYLVYDFVTGASLSDCLRNPRNANFTILSSWMSRMQIATDLAHGLDYVHNNAGGLSAGFVHKYVKSGSVIVTEPSFNAKICHFGAAELCGEAAVKAEDGVESPPRAEEKGSGGRVFEGARGYMSPEFQSSGIATQKSDVYALGVLILELLSGEEPLRYKFDRASSDYRKISVIDAARYAVDDGGCGREEVEGRLRKWVDRRLKDSFPVAVAEKVVRVALECVRVDADKRPGMQRVAGKISKLYLESRIWCERVRVPTEFSVSFAPR